MLSIYLILIIILIISLIISESLPFIKLKSNGLLDILVNTIYVKNRETETETEPLLDNDDTIINIDSQLHNLINRLDILTVNLTEKFCNLTMTIKQCNLPILNNNIAALNENIINTKQLKLQQSNLYELNFIINYIKSNYPKKSYPTKFLAKSNKELLISEGYIIDYDAEKDVYIIKW